MHFHKLIAEFDDILMTRLLKVDYYYYCRSSPSEKLVSLLAGAPVVASWMCFDKSSFFLRSNSLLSSSNLTFLMDSISSVTNCISWSLSLDLASSLSGSPEIFNLFRVRSYLVRISDIFSYLS